MLGLGGVGLAAQAVAAQYYVHHQQDRDRPGDQTRNRSSPAPVWLLNGRVMSNTR